MVFMSFVIIAGVSGTLLAYYNQQRLGYIQVYSEDFRRGLYGSYYQNIDWQGDPWKQEMLDPMISHHTEGFKQLHEMSQPFSVAWRGYIKIPKTSEYKFRTDSDDGSWLWIDDVLVVDNGGEHTKRKAVGIKKLTAGFHKIRIRYAQYGDNANLKVYWTSNDIPRELIPAEVLFPPDFVVNRFFLIKIGIVCFLWIAVPGGCYQAWKHWRRKFAPSTVGSDKKVLILIGLLGIFVLSGLKLTTVPEVYRDAQAYIQSALFWPEGKVSPFFASLMGDRHLTIWYYHIFLRFFGHSIDALTIALSGLYLINSLAIMCSAFLMISRPFGAFIISSGINFLSYFLQTWNFPSTEPTSTVAVTCMILLWSITIRHQKNILLWFACAFGAGFLDYTRQGLILFLGGIIITSIAIGISRRWRKRRLILTILMLMIGLYAGGFLGRSAWVLWIPVPKPYSYKKTYLTGAIARWGHYSEGPTGQALARTMGVEPHTRIDAWRVAMFTFSQYGPQQSDTLSFDLAKETIKAHPNEFIRFTAQTFVKYLTHRGNFALSIQPYHQQYALFAQRLAKYDKSRVTDQLKYGLKDDYYTTKTEKITAQHLPIITAIRKYIPAHRFSFELPGVVLLILPVVLLVHRKYWIWCLPFLTYAWGGCFLAAFTQVYAARYLHPTSLNGWFLLWMYLFNIHQHVFVKNDDA